MKKARLLGAVFACLSGAGMISSVDAALIGRLPDSNGIFQVVYDSGRQITWLANANYPATETFGLDGTFRYADNGSMHWDRVALPWMDHLNESNYLGFNEWRLPAGKWPDDTCGASTGAGTPGCTGGELGHLFYEELGGVAGTALFLMHNEFYDMFSSIQNGEYWTSLEVPVSSNVWAFSMTGFQSQKTKGSYAYVWAVADGDPFALVPLPAAVWLFGSGLLGLIGVARRKA